MKAVARFMKTGEVGFCPTCGTITEVVVLPDDRLQARVVRGARRRLEEAARGNGTPYIEGVVFFVRRLQQAIGRVSEGLPIDREEEGLLELMEDLVEVQIWLALTGEKVGELLDEAVDLLRLAAERVEEPAPKNGAG